MTDEVTQAEQAAWIAGIDEGMSRKAAPSAVAAPEEWLSTVRNAYKLVSAHAFDISEGDQKEMWDEQARELGELLEAMFAADRAALAATTEREVALPEPVAHLWQHGETGRTRVVMPDMVVTADANWLVVSPLYTEQQVRALLATGGQAQAQAVEQEPFGYFKAEPFGWTDCGPDDEGAVALYERPQAQADARDAGRYRDLRGLLYEQDVAIDEATLIFKVTGQCPTTEEFDAGVDSAIAAAKGKQ